MKLAYEQYFIDTANLPGGRFPIKYKSVKYYYKGLICHANYEIHYEEDRNVIQIHFEKTDGKIDWLVNFMFVQDYYDSFYYKDKLIKLKVHNGWAAMYKAIKKQLRLEILKLLNEHFDATIEIIGWSLGSGQAMLCAQDIFYNFNRKSNVYTYGSVNPFKTNIFNRRKIRNYLRECCNEVYNFSDRSDIVTYLPFRLLGFIKIKRVNVKGRFKFFGLFNPNKYHTHYYEKSLYSKIYEKEKVIE